MSTYAVVEMSSALIVNRIVIDVANEWPVDEGHFLIEETSHVFAIGGHYRNGVYEPLPVAAIVDIVPQQISDRQFFQQLAIDGIISEDEALASNAAVIPQPLLSIIEQLPADQQFDAKMKVSGATTFYREDPLTVGIGTAYGMSSAQIDAFFTAASDL